MNPFCCCVTYIPFMCEDCRHWFGAFGNVDLLSTCLSTCLPAPPPSACVSVSVCVRARVRVYACVCVCVCVCVCDTACSLNPCINTISVHSFGWRCSYICSGTPLRLSSRTPRSWQLPTKRRTVLDLFTVYLDESPTSDFGVGVLETDLVPGQPAVLTTDDYFTQWVFCVNYHNQYYVDWIKS